MREYEIKVRLYGPDWRNDDEESKGVVSAWAARDAAHGWVDANENALIAMVRNLERKSSRRYAGIRVKAIPTNTGEHHADIDVPFR